MRTVEDGLLTRDFHINDAKCHVYFKYNTRSYFRRTNYLKKSVFSENGNLCTSLKTEIR